MAELRHRGLPMETILRSKVHGRGGLIRKVLCGPPEAALLAGAIPPTDAEPPVSKTVSSYMVNVTAVDDD